MDFEYVLIATQCILGLNFLITGGMKFVADKETLISKIGWPRDYSEKVIKFFGFWEVVGAVGILLPLVVPALAIVVPLAATGLGLIMAGSMVTHIQREDMAKLTMSLFMFFIAVVAGFGRLVELTF